METKVCSKCRLEKPKSEFSPRPERLCGVYSSCKICKAAFRSKRHFERRLSEPVDYWVIRTRNSVRDRARKIGFAYELSDADLRHLVEENSSCCAYCDVVLDFNCDLSERWNSPSLDRILPTEGYVRSNVVLCCYRCNMIKSEASPQELRQLADRVERLMQIRGLKER